MSDLKIVVTGASGRMGRTLIREIAQGSGITLCGALEMEGHPNLGLDSGQVAGKHDRGAKLTERPSPGQNGTTDQAGQGQRNSNPPKGAPTPIAQRRRGVFEDAIHGQKASPRRAYIKRTGHE